MQLREKAINILKIIKNNTKQTIREIAAEAYIPKSTVQRQMVTQQTRINSVGHDFFETDAGAKTLEHFFFSVIFIFGIQAGVGAETISLFFNSMSLTSYVGSSPSCIRTIKNEMRAQIDAYGKLHMEKIIALCKDKALHLGGDETFFGKLVFLVLMELTSGFIFTEELANDRTYSTWWVAIKDKIKGAKKILSVTSDGAKALKKIGKKLVAQSNTAKITGSKKNRMQLRNPPVSETNKNSPNLKGTKKPIDNNIMDLFHLLSDPKKLLATKFHSKSSSIEAERKKLLKNPLNSEKDQQQALSAFDDKLTVINKGQQNYRDAMFEIATQVHPFKSTFETKSSKELSEELHQQEKRFREIADSCEIKDDKNLLDRFERRIEASSLLNDLWHQWVEQSVLCKTEDLELKAWAKNFLLPYFYFKEQVRKSRRKKGLKKYYQNLVEKIESLLYSHPRTAENLNDDWISWAKEMALKYQRSTSAIEGRNGRLSQHYFSSRGIRPSHINPLTVIHNFWIKRQDSTTAAERLCGYKPPDLLEYILQNMREVPMPRKRNNQLALAA